MTLDEHLRRELRARADGLVPHADLLDRVAGRRRQHVRRRRRALTGGGVALALLAIVAGMVVPRWSIAPPPLPAVSLVAGPQLTYPLTPTWEPNWVGTRWFSYQEGESWVLRYDVTYPRGAVLSATVSPGNPLAEGQPTTVDGHPATWSLTSDGFEVAWRLSEGWVLVAGNSRVTQAELLQYAAGLAETPLRMPTPFDLARVPADAQVESFDRSSMVFSRLGQPSQLLTITLVPATRIPSPTPNVRGKPVDDYRALRVTASPQWGLTTHQLDQIADGVSVTPVAVTTGG